MDLLESLKEELGEIPDRRVLGRTRHVLSDILVLSTLAILCQAETWIDIESFGHSKLEWLKGFLELPNGIPSHDTISRVFSLVEPTEFEKAFVNWVNRVRLKRGVTDVLCIDGKVVRGTVPKHGGNSRGGLTVVSVWSTVDGLVIGQTKANGTGNGEVVAITELLNLLNIEGLIVVGDAGIGKKSVMEKIVAQGGDYVFPIKGNSGLTHQVIKETFSKFSEKKSTSKLVQTHSIREKGHGRVEHRHCTILHKRNFPAELAAIASKLPALKTVGRIVYESSEKETRPYIYADGEYLPVTDPVRKKKEVRYFISSLKLSAKNIMEKLRLQWAIENQLHWVLDVSLHEDGNKTRNRIAAANLSTVRRIAVNLVKQDKTTKAGIKTKLKKAGWNSKYLENLLFKSSLN